MFSKCQHYLMRIFYGSKLSDYSLQEGLVEFSY